MIHTPPMPPPGIGGVFYSVKAASARVQSAKLCAVFIQIQLYVKKFYNNYTNPLVCQMTSARRTGTLKPSGKHRNRSVRRFTQSEQQALSNKAQQRWPYRVKPNGKGGILTMAKYVMA
ncbi:MAG: hypothetical protein MR483_03285, partial [Bacteroidales bacterium]|nr:hypothetical protein [Bacteroidales bacterium]